MSKDIKKIYESWTSISDIIGIFYNSFKHILYNKYNGNREKIKDTLKYDTAIVSIMRGGLCPCTMFSHHISNKCLVNIPWYFIQYQRLDNNDDKPILINKIDNIPQKNIIIIEDIVDKGITMSKIINMPIFKEKNIFLYSIYMYNGGLSHLLKSTPLDINLNIEFAKELDSDNPRWVVFPWENCDEQDK